MVKLYQVDSPITREQRNNINATFADILIRFTNLKYQISILSGGEDLEEVLQRIEDAITNSNNTTANTQQVLNDISDALNQLETALQNSSDATQAADSAASSVTNAINDMQNLVNQLGNAESYNNTKTYVKNNIVEYNGSSYIALQQTTGNTPPVLPTKQNVYWQLIAQRGVDGSGSVSSVNGISPNVNGDVVLTPSDIDAASKFRVSELGVNVKDFGAIGDGVNDDTTAILAAISSSNNSDIIFFPKGIYRVTQQITLPKGKTLLGVNSDAAPQFYNGTWDTSKFGSVIAIDHGDGDTLDENAAILLTSYNKIEGLNFWYPSQSGNTATPLQYPPTLALVENDSEEANGRATQVNISNCVFVNPYICMSFISPHELLNISNVKFAAWFTGIMLENSYDVDRLESVHSNPNISYRGEWPENGIFKYHTANSQTKGFRIGKNDHLYIDKCFIFGFNTCIEFSTITSGSINGCFVNESGFEGCSKAVSLFNDYQRVSFNQCMFGTLTDFPGSEATIYASRNVNNASRNELRMTDCHSFASMGRALVLENQNDVTLVNTHFYDVLTEAHEYDMGGVLISGCKKVNLTDCTVHLNPNNSNSLFYEIGQSTMIKLNNVDFAGYLGAIEKSSSTITDSTKVRIISPSYTNSNNTGTYQNNNTDIVIEDIISY